ncbi:MAG: hypothetical protein ACTHOJ_07465 [Sphingomonas oligoaromativorans]
MGAPRKLAALPADKRLSAADLREAIADADTIEILFSDGKREIQALGRRKVTGDAWAARAGGLLLTHPVDLHGAGAGSGPIVIAGYALLLDGELVATSPREPMAVPANGHVRLENDIIF